MITIMSQLLEDLRTTLPRAACTHRTVPAGETLFRQGDPPKALFVLSEGRIDLMRWTAGGSPIRLHSAGAGETLAEASLFAGTYHCDALARSEARATGFDRAAILDACNADPAIACAIMRHLAVTLREARRIIELRSVEPLKERVLARLSDLADDDGALPPGLRIKDMAAEIGATPEATYRAMATLAAERRVSRERRGVFRLVLSHGSDQPSRTMGTTRSR